MTEKQGKSGWFEGASGMFVVGRRVETDQYVVRIASVGRCRVVGEELVTTVVDFEENGGVVGT